MLVEASPIKAGLWQGSAPPVGDAVRKSGFDVLVLCAEEYQPPASAFPGVEVIHAPNDDSKLTRTQLAGALQAAHRAALALKQGKQVLVTCRVGWNRSGLVSALSLHLLTGKSGGECVGLVQRGREGALGNPYFVAALERLQSATVAQASS